MIFDAFWTFLDMGSEFPRLLVLLYEKDGLAAKELAELKADYCHQSVNLKR